MRKNYGSIEHHSAITLPHSKADSPIQKERFLSPKSIRFPSGPHESSILLRL